MSTRIHTADPAWFGVRYIEDPAVLTELYEGDASDAEQVALNRDHVPCIVFEDRGNDEAFVLVLPQRSGVKAPIALVIDQIHSAYANPATSDEWVPEIDEDDDGLA